MKKIFSILILMVLAVSLIAPLAVLAQKEKLKECCTIKQDISWKKGTIYEDAYANVCNNTAANPCQLKKTETIGEKAGVACPKPGDAAGRVSVVDYNADQWGMVCIVNTVMYVTNWIFYLMMIAVVIIFVIAGAMYMMSSGDPEKTKSAKGLIIFGIVGLVIALIARLIPSVVKLIIGM